MVLCNLSGIPKACIPGAVVELLTTVISACGIEFCSLMNRLVSERISWSSGLRHVWYSFTLLAAMALPFIGLFL